MNAAIDIGNTFVKLGFFEGDTLVNAFEGLSREAALQHCTTFSPSHVILSSVGTPAQEWTEALSALSSQVFILHATLPVPLVNHYETPATLGTDRIAAAVGAKVLYPADACLVIDMGTCITYDLVDANHHYWGGSISPG